LTEFTSNPATALRFARTLAYRLREIIPRMSATDSAAKAGENMQKIRIEQHPFMGSVWVAAWLFTVGFLHLSVWKTVLAVLLWPYFLGLHFCPVVH
jgi:hypothetical protein